MLPSVRDSRMSTPSQNSTNTHRPSSTKVTPPPLTPSANSEISDLPDSFLSNAARIISVLAIFALVVALCLLGTIVDKRLGLESLLDILRPGTIMRLLAYALADMLQRQFVDPPLPVPENVLVFGVGAMHLADIIDGNVI